MDHGILARQWTWPLRAYLWCLVEYFSPSWPAFQAERGRGFSVIVDGVSD
jgi:hypothetical protein